MTVSELQRLQQTPRFFDEGGLLPTPRTSSGPGFGDTLAEAIDEVDASMKVADAKVESFIAGETDNVHEVMIAMNQAEMHFKLMTEVRNKMLSTYEQLINMQV